MSRRVAALTTAVTATAVVAVSDGLVAWHHVVGAPHAYGYWFEGGFVGLGYGLLTALLVARQPRNPVTWVFGALTAAGLVQILAGTLAAMVPVWAGPFAVQLGLAVTSSVGQLLVVALAAPLFLLLPDGRLPSRRWRPALWLSFVGLAVFPLSALLDVGDAGSAWIPRNPIAAVAPSVVRTIGSQVGAIPVVAVVIGVISLVWRWRTAAREQRQQLRLIGFACLLTVLLVTLGALVESLVLPRSWQGHAGTFTWAVAGSFPGVGIVLAMLRYRLYDIDRVVSRTVTYTVVTALLVGVYVGCVALTTRMLPFSSSLGVAASTLAAAALFHPLRGRVQGAVDRRFNRARYNAARTVEAFSVRLRDEVDVETVRTELAMAVHRTVQPASLSLCMVGLT